MSEYYVLTDSGPNPHGMCGPLSVEDAKMLAEKTASKGLRCKVLQTVATVEAVVIAPTTDTPQ